MLGKILLTAAVVCIAYFVIRQRQISEEAGAGSQHTRVRADSKQDNASTAANQDPGLARDLRVGAYLFLVMMVGLAGIMYYYQWQDDHQIITVNLYRDGVRQPVSYEVYKHELGERSFTTVDGLTVTVAASERMEIEGLNN